MRLCGPATGWHHSPAHAQTTRRHGTFPPFSGCGPRAWLGEKKKPRLLPVRGSMGAEDGLYDGHAFSHGLPLVNLPNLLDCCRQVPDLIGSNGGPGRVRTDDVLSEADYESAACNQHGVRPTKLPSVAKTTAQQQKSPVYPKAGLFDDRPTYYTKHHRPGHLARDFRALKLTGLNSLQGKT